MIDKEIFKTASNNKDYGHLDNYSHYSNSKSSTCGDNIKIYIQVKKRNVKRKNALIGREESVIAYKKILYIFLICSWI